jgi:hypothetical protein
MEGPVENERSRKGWWIVVVAILGTLFVVAELWSNVVEELRPSEETHREGP